MLDSFKWWAKQGRDRAKHDHVLRLEELYLFTSNLIKGNRVGDIVASFWREVRGIIDEHAALPQVGDATIIGFFIQTDQDIGIIAHGPHRLVANTHLEQKRPAENFSRKGAEGIHMIPPTRGSLCKDITARDGTLT